MACFGGTPRARRRRRGAKREIGRCPSRRLKATSPLGHQPGYPFAPTNPYVASWDLTRVSHSKFGGRSRPGAPRRPVSRTDRSRGRPHRRPRPSVPPTSTAPPPLPAGRIRYTGRPKTYMVYRYTGCAGGRAGPQFQAAVFHPRRLVLGPSTSRWSQNPCCVVRQPAGPRVRAGRVMVSLPVDPSRVGRPTGPGRSRRDAAHPVAHQAGHPRRGGCEGDAVPGT